MACAKPVIPPTAASTPPSHSNMSGADEPAQNMVSAFAVSKLLSTDWKRAASPRAISTGSFFPCIALDMNFLSRRVWRGDRLVRWFFLVNRSKEFRIKDTGELLVEAELVL